VERSNAAAGWSDGEGERRESGIVCDRRRSAGCEEALCPIEYSRSTATVLYQSSEEALVMDRD